MPFKKRKKKTDEPVEVIGIEQVADLRFESLPEITDENVTEEHICDPIGESMDDEVQNILSESEDKAYWFFTYVQRDTLRKNKYSLVYIEDYAKARQFVFDSVGSIWAFMYPISDLQKQIDEFGLTEQVELYYFDEDESR